MIAAVGPSILGACVLLFGIEGALRFFEWRHHVPLSGDPFVNVTPFFFRAVDEQGVPVYRHHGGKPQFRVTKPANGFRIFVLGESSVYGIPYNPEYSFASFLEQRLAAALPDRTVEVVNCGVPAIASWHIRRIALEIMAYDPDVVLVYAGHNDYTTREMPEPGWWTRKLVEMRAFQASVWAGQVLRQWWSGPFDKGLALDPAQPFLIGQRAAGTLTMTPQERREIADRFARNVGEIIAAAKDVGALPMVASVGQNFRNWAPSAWRHRTDLTPADGVRWGQHWGAAERLRKANDCAGALREYDAAAEVDARPAIIQWQRARCLERLGRWPEARVAFRRASDLDEVPMGVPTSFNAMVRKTTEADGGVFVDVARRLEDTSPQRIPGNDVFMDHLHPNLLGNERIAEIVANRLRELGVPEPASKWVDGTYAYPDPDALRRADPKIAEMEKFSLDLTRFFVAGGGTPKAATPAR